MRKLILLLLASLASASAQKIVGGPYVVEATQRTATIVWIVESGEVSIQPAAGQQVTAQPPRVSPAFRVEKTTLTGLAANTRYTYEVGGKESAKGSFKTAATPADPYNFVIYGDNRTRHDVHKKVIAELAKHPVPDFVLQTGDMVEDGNSNSLWPIFFDIERDLLRQTAFFPSLGNHERNSHNYYEFFLGTHPYYSFNWGNAHFAMIDSDIGNTGATKRERDLFWAEQTAWLENDLASTQAAEYRFVVAHHPPFTAVTSRQGNNAHMTALTPMFEKYHVSGALFGHDHNYQHYLKNGIHYVVTGGGGAPLYDVDTPPKDITQKVEKIENFVQVSVNGKTAKFQAIAVDGRVIDEFEIKGSAQPK
jgi:acid phosphatase type 7